MTALTVNLLPIEEWDPITLDGEPVVTWRMTHMVEIGGRLYEQEFAGSDDCSCRRCSLHEDFGGCIVDEALWGLVLWMSDPTSAPLDFDSDWG